MPTWRIAPALETLRQQLNEAFPRRSKVSDGGIGDAGHASRNSDHNPWVKDSKGMGVVTARDFTHDPKTGIDCNWLAGTLVKNKDPRIKYIIWNKRICSALKGWEWRPYHGVNSHQHHLHLSVSDHPDRYDSSRDWKLDFPSDEFDDIAKVSAAVPQSNAIDPQVENSNDPGVSTEQPPPIEQPVTTTVTEATTTETASTVVSTTQPAGDPPDIPPTQVSQNGPLAKWLVGGGGLTAVGTFVWGYIQSNPSAVGIAVICVTLLIVAIIFRGAITDAIRMQTAADPEKKNVS